MSHQATVVAGKFLKNQLLSVLMELMYNSWAQTELRGCMAFSEWPIIGGE